MSEFKCPFCWQKLKYDAWNEMYICINPNCKHLLGFGTEELRQELIRTRNALEIAKDALNWIDKTYQTGQELETDIRAKVQDVRKRIKALEQKDK